MGKSRFEIYIEYSHAHISVDDTEFNYQVTDDYETGGCKIDLDPDETLELARALVKSIKCQGCGKRGALKRQIPEGELWLCTFCACLEAAGREDFIS